MKIKTKKSYPFTSARMATIKKGIKKFDKNVEEREPCPLLLEIQIGTASMANSVEVPQKLKLALL